MTEPLSSARLTDYLADARARTLELVHGLDDAQLMGPRLDIVNPLLWEIGHVGWFHEYFALRRLDGGSPRLPNADALYNSSTVPHDDAMGAAVAVIARDTATTWRGCRTRCCSGSTAAWRARTRLRCI